MRRGKKVLAGLLGVVLSVATIFSGFSLETKAANETLLNTYGATYGHVGTCINSWQLKDAATMSHVKSQYNSITLENEMKPDALLGGSASLITVNEAKRLGYYIPDNYTETYVPKINFSTVDSVLKTCYENGIGVRAHTLVWHSQTPTWFFRYGYSGRNGFVSTSMMDARMEMYIKTVMNHVYTSQYGSVVYAWDVVNEYFHATDSGWEAVYGKCGTKPGFVKKAFQYAYDCLDYFKLTGKVSLFYNDFNTYMEVNDVITMINYINAEKKICSGVGMQSHLGTTFPSVDYYTNALRSFLKAGFEVQITELDVTNSSAADQANYLYQLFQNINALKKSGGKITGITFWGLSDDVSWISGNKNPLLFSKLNQPKSSYYKVLQAYSEASFASNGGNTSGGNTNTGNQTGSTTGNDNKPYASIQDGWYFIKNCNAQKYLTVEGNVGENGRNVEISTGTGTDGQKWYVKNNGDGTVTMKNSLGYMLDVTEGKAANVTNIEIWTENGKTPQVFMLKDAGNGQYGILTKATNGSGCLDTANAETKDGTNVQQYTYYASKGQLWNFEPVPVNNNQNNQQEAVNTKGVKIADGWYYLKNVNSQKYLQVAGNKKEAASNVEIGTGTGVAGQKWYVTNTTDGYITLTSGLGNYMLDVANGKDEDGANLQIYDAYSGNPQKFVVLATATDGVYTIGTKSSGLTKMVDVYNHGKTDGTNVCQWTYYGNPNQQWIFEPVKQENNQTQAGTNTGNQNVPGNQTNEGTTQTPQNPTAGISAVYTTVSDWGSSFQGQIVITNQTNQTLNGWTLTFDYANGVSNLWGADYVGQNGTQVSVKAPEWAKELKAGDSVTIQFIATGKSTDVPYNVVVK